MSVSEMQEHTFVKVLYDFRYKTTEGREIAIKKNEQLYLLQKTNADWWQVVRTWEQRSFYVPATYVREVSNCSIKNSEEERDAPLDGPKYKNMPEETSSAMRNVKKWLAGANNCKQESSKGSYVPDEAQKQYAMNYTARAEMKVGLAAIKSKSLERDHNLKIDTREQRLLKDMQQKVMGGSINDQEFSKLPKCFSTSPRSYDIHSRMEMARQDPFRQELETSLDRRRKKSDNSGHETLREPDSLRDRRSRKKSSHSDDSVIDSDVDDRFLPRIHEQPKQFDKTDQTLGVLLRDEAVVNIRQSPSASRRSSRSSSETDARQFCMRTERSLSPKPTYGRQLSIAEGQITDDEVESNLNDHKLLTDKRRTWVVDELMSELSQMCKDRVNTKKPNFQLKSTEIKSTVSPLEELTKELYETNLQRSESKPSQVEGRMNEFKYKNTSPSNVSKVSINVENIASLDCNSSAIIGKENESHDIIEHSNVPDEVSDNSKSSLPYHSPKPEKTSAFTFRTTEVVIPHSKASKSPKSPKILDEYNEANILNDCSPDDSPDDTESLSRDKQSLYLKQLSEQTRHPEIDHTSPCYSNVKTHQGNIKVKMRPKVKPNSPNQGELRMTPSLEKLASEIQFIPARRTSDETKMTAVHPSVSDLCNDSGIIKFDTWDRKRIVGYGGSFKTKREARYFYRGENLEVENSINSAKQCGLQRSTTLHFTSRPGQLKRFDPMNLFKRQSRSLSDLRCLEEEITPEGRPYNQEIPILTKSKPVPLPRTKIPAVQSTDVREIDVKPVDTVESNVKSLRIPLPRNTSNKIEDITMGDPWERLNLPGTVRVDIKPNHLDHLTSNEVDIESSTAVDFKTLLCTSNSDSENCLQSKELLSHDHNGHYLGKSNSASNLKKDIVKTRESPSEEQILSSNASSEALQSQSESEVTAAFDVSSQPSPVSTRIVKDGYECAINLPPGWTQKYDVHAEQIYFVNDKGDRWFSSNDDEGKIYFFEENSNESSWVLPTITHDKNKLKPQAPGENTAVEDTRTIEEIPQAESSTLTTSQPESSGDGSMLRSKSSGGCLGDWPQLSFDGNMRILKDGSLSRTKITENGKKLRKNWSTSYAVLTELFLLFFKDAKTFNTMMKSGQSPIAKPDISVDLNGAIIEPGDRASSRKNVYMISTVLGLQVLIQSDNAPLATEWFQGIHGAIFKLPFSFNTSAKPSAGPPEGKRTSKHADAKDADDSKRSSKISRSRSMRMKKLDDSLEDLSATAAERQTKIKARLRRFFQRRPTVESLVNNGIYKNEPAFGCHLRDVCPAEYPRIPLFVKMCIEILESNEENMKTDGLYRASGNLSQIQRIRLQVDQYNLNVLNQEDDVHVLTGALKLFFRELKEPLIPSIFFKEALNASMLKKASAKVQCFRDIVKALPPPNYDTLQFLLKHLLKVTLYQEFNRMHIPNLAIVFGPTLMWPAEESANMALDLMQQNLVIECLLSEYNKIFK